MNSSNGRRFVGGLGVLSVALVSFALGGSQGGPKDAVAAPATVEFADMDAMKAMLVDGFERAKIWDLSIVEAMPESAMDWSPAEGVRSFSDQVIHASGSGFIGRSVFGESAPERTVSEGGGADKSAIIAAITADYDWLINKFKALPSADLASEADFFGGQKLPRWRIGLFALEHAMWTRGQMVPYFHANGAAPPSVVLLTPAN